MNPWDEVFAEALRTGSSDGLIERFYNLCLADSEQQLLNAEANAAWATEQRIIKLLESQLGAYENTPTVTPDFGLEVAINLVKALIKGEK